MFSWRNIKKKHKYIFFFKFLFIFGAKILQTQKTHPIKVKINYIYIVLLSCFVWVFFTKFFGFALFCSILCAFVLIPRPGTNQWICCIKYYLNYQRYTWLSTNTSICSFFQAKLNSVHKDMLDILLCREPLRLFGLVLFSWFVTWILRAGLVGWTLPLLLFICLTWSTGTGSWTMLSQRWRWNGPFR